VSDGCRSIWPGTGRRARLSCAVARAGASAIAAGESARIFLKNCPVTLNPCVDFNWCSTPGLRGKNSGIAYAAPTQPRSAKTLPDLNHIGNTESIAASRHATASYCAAPCRKRLTIAAVRTPYPLRFRALVDLAFGLSETGKLALARDSSES